MSSPPASASELAGRVAIVTGGSRGLGAAIAETIGRAGARVVVADIEMTRASERAAALNQLDIDAVAMPLDVGDEEQVRHLIDAVSMRYGKLDALINNAGVGLFRAVGEMTDDEWRRLFDTNVTGVFNATRAALPHLRARGGGWIVNVSSLSATAPFANGAAYCATKAAVDAFTEALMQELRHDGIRVASVAPGSVDTTFGGGRDKSSWALQPGDVAQVIVDLMSHAGRALPSRVEVRPSQPPRKG